MLKKYLSGHIKIWFKDQELEYQKLLVKKEPMSRTREYKIKTQQQGKVKRTLIFDSKPFKRVKPAPSHPWRAPSAKWKKVSNLD